MAIGKKAAPRRKLGFALSGGGARGAFQVGVYERILEDPRFAGMTAVLSGTSAGAINAALIAAGKSPDELLAFWLDLAERPPVAADRAFTGAFFGALASRLREERPTSAGRTVVDFLKKSWRLGSASASAVELVFLDRFDLLKGILRDLRASALFDTRPLRARLVQALGGETVRTVPGVELAIQAVDALAGTSVRWVTHENRHTKGEGYEIVDAITVDMILASASIPLLFPAVDVDERKLWDGGVLVNTPLAPLVDLGATEIVTVLVTEKPADGLKAFDNLGDALERVTDTLLENTYNMDRKLLLERNRLAEKDPRRYRAVTLYEAIRPSSAEVFTVGSYLDFHTEAVLEMARAGREAATRWIADGPRPDRIER